MKNYILLIILVTTMMGCGTKKSPTWQKLESTADSFPGFKAYNFKSPEPSYYLLGQQSMQSFLDTITAVNSLAFGNEEGLNELNAKIENWMSNSLFITTDNNGKGTLKIDSVNLLEKADSTKPHQFSGRSVAYGQKLIALKNLGREFLMGKRTIYYTILPHGDGETKTQGQFLLETTGVYKPSWASENPEIPAVETYDCEAQNVRWIIKIRSRGVNLAIALPDRTRYYIKHKL